MKQIKKLLTDKELRFRYLGKAGLTNWIPDKRFLKLKYKLMFNKKLHLTDPKTFNEKLQWLKLYDRRPIYTTIVDKYKVREYIAEKIGSEYLVPFHGAWDTEEEINFDILPDQFVLKCNHNSGIGMCICTDKSKLDIKKVKKELKRGLKQNYYKKEREWPYKDVPRKIIAEMFLKSDEGGLTDYKVHCFNGEPKLILVCKDRFTVTGLTEDFYSEDWIHLNIKRPDIEWASSPIQKPEQLDEILQLSRTLSKDIPFLRVDFYIVEGKVYFSELTLYPASGFSSFEPQIWDDKLGEWLHLPD